MRLVSQLSTKASTIWHLRLLIMWHRRTNRATFRSHTTTLASPLLVLTRAQSVFDSLIWTELSWIWRTTRSQDQHSSDMWRQIKRWRLGQRCRNILKARIQLLTQSRSFQHFKSKSKTRRKPYVSLSCQMIKRLMCSAVCSRMRMIRDL